MNAVRKMSDHYLKIQIYPEKKVNLMFSKGLKVGQAVRTMAIN